MNKKVFAIVALLSVTSAVFGYQFGVSNKTDKTLLVRLQIRSGGYNYNLIKPNRRETFDFTGGSAGQALQSIFAEAYDPEEVSRYNNQYKGLNLMDIKNKAGGVLEGDSYHAFTELANRYSTPPVKMKMVDAKVYAAIAKAATALVSGIDTFACKALDIAMSSTPEGSIANDVRKLITTSASEDKDKVKTDTVDVVEKTKKANANPTDQTAQVVAKKAVDELANAKNAVTLGNVEYDLMDLVLDSATFEYITKPVPAAMALIERNKDPLGVVAYGQLVILLKDGKNEEALKVIQNRINALKSSTTKTSIDDEAMVYGCSSCGDMNTYGATADTKKDCSFGLGEMSSAIGDLVGLSMTKNREFMLVPGKKEGQINAITVKD